MGVRAVRPPPSSAPGCMTKRAKGGGGTARDAPRPRGTKDPDRTRADRAARPMSPGSPLPSAGVPPMRRLAIDKQMERALVLKGGGATQAAEAAPRLVLELRCHGIR